jgi:hypothetical protein
MTGPDQETRRILSELRWGLENDRGATEERLAHFVRMGCRQWGWE